MKPLAGMDDEDIEWELGKMEEAERRREVPQQSLRTVYRPVDSGLAARIFRQMGQPYDPQAIDPREAFYIGGWDNGDDTVVEKNRRVEPAPLRDGAMGAEEYDPWAKAWKPDWGEEGRPAERPKTMEWRWGRDEPGLVSRDGVKNALVYGPGEVDAAPVMQPFARGGGEYGEVLKPSGFDWYEMFPGVPKEKADREWGGIFEPSKETKDFIFKQVIPFGAEWGPTVVSGILALKYPKHRDGISGALTVAGEIGKRMSSNYDNPSYTFEHAVRESLVPLGIELTAGDYTAEKVTEELAKKYNLPEPAQTVLKDIMAKMVTAGTVEAIKSGGE